MRRIARPNRQIERPARSPASARVFTRATLLAKVVATTMPLALATSFSISGPTEASERPGWRENTLVLSQISALTPGAATSCQSARSKASPTSGVSSNLKSPVWINRPSGQSITSALLSGIECEIGRKPTENGPAWVTTGHAETVFTARSGCPISSILRRKILEVKARA